MWWPRRSIESIPSKEFRPPFCPREGCPSDPKREPARFKRHGVFIRKCDGRVVPRFFCKTCKKTCSQQTFSCTYYLKRPELLVAVAAGLNAGSAHRQLARSLRCSASTVTGLAARLGRHALLLLALSLQQIDRIREPVVYDDFESFAFSQDNPFGMGTAVGQRSWFWYWLERAPHQRAPRAATRGARPGAEHRQSGSYTRSFRRLLDGLAQKADEREPLRLITDGHLGYRAGLARHPARDRFSHRSFPNPPRGRRGDPRSTEAARRDREMFPVDLLHKLIRHSLAHHRRETIAFGRRLNALLERGFLMAIWRNFVKARTERTSDPTTPGMFLGLTRNPWDWERVLSRRIFHRQVQVPESWMPIYRRQLVTTAIGTNRPHLLVNAF